MVDVRPPVVMSALTPERVAGAEFGNSFRGFDPTQVRGFLARVAADLDALLERERELNERVAELEQRLAEATKAGNQTLDEHQLTELLGAETARVLEAARDAASVLRANAQQQAAATVAAAEAEAAQLRAQAEALLDERAQTAEAEAARLLEDAERDAARLREEAEALREEAQREGDEQRAMARDEGRRMVAEARAVRERILTDMARRRNQARQQLERLRAGRERLLDAIEVVRRAIDGASGELNDAVVEAKLAGERAARQVDLEAVPPISELDAEVELARDAGLIDVEALEREVAGAIELADDEPEVEAEPAGAAGADRPVEGPETVPPTDAEAVGDLDSGAPPDEPVPAVVESTDALQRIDVESTEAVQRIDVESTEAVQRTDAVQRIDVESTDGLPDVDSGLAAEAEQAADDQPAPSDPADADAQAEAELLVPAVPPARRQGFSHAVDDLFSRWKHEDGDHPDVPTGAEATAAPSGVDAGSPQGSAARSADAGRAKLADHPMADEAESNGSIGARPAADVPDGAAAVARQTRDAVLAGIARDLTRHLKLALSDEQNLVLEDQRDGRAPRQPKRAVADLIEEMERSDRFEQATRRELTGVLEAGWGAISTGGGEGPDPRLLDPVVDEVCRLLTAPLHDRLRRALDDAGDSNVAAERVRNLYRETRNEQAASLAEHGALMAFAVGQYAAAGQLPAGDDVRVRWAFDACVPDCYDNFLAGGLLLGTAFPTDHRHPPAFPGCRCLLMVESRVKSIGADGSSDARVPRGHLPPTAV